MNASAAKDGLVHSERDGWHALLDLEFRQAGERTVFVRREGYGPLQVQRPFYPEGGVCHLYLLHPPGGVVGGDRLEVRVHVDAEARALITTPAAGKCYRSDGRQAELLQCLSIAPGGVLEWFPMETIVFAGANARSTTRIELVQDARFIGWEIACLGRPAAAERFDAGLFDQRMEVYRHGRPLLIERNRFEGGGDMLRGAWGLGGATVAGTLIATDCDERDAQVAHEVIEADGRAAVTLVDGLLLVRCLGHHAERIREQLTRVWQAIRPRLLGLAAESPRIWRT